MNGITVNHETAARLVALQRQADRHEDRALDWKIRANPEHFRKFGEIRAAGERVRWQSNLHGPFLQHSAPAWKICGPDDELATPAERIAEHQRFQEAEADYAQFSEAETGMGVSPEQFERQRNERSEVRRQSHKLAGMLESAGVQAYRNDAFRLWVWYIHTRTAEEIPAFRRICLLPYVAAIVRAGKLAALEYFLQRNLFCRFWTFTSGTRCTIAELGDRISDLHARLNGLNKQLRKRFGVEFVFRSTELGTVEFSTGSDGGAVEFDETGNPLFHPHAHVVVNSLVGYIAPKRWEQMVRFVWAEWQNHWDAGSLIRNARECCKYVTKPGDMLRLSAAQLAALFEQLSGKRLVAPLGSLKREIAARRAAGKILRRKRTPEGTVWREAFDQNKHVESDQEDRDAVFRMHQAETRDRIDARHGYHKEGTLRRLSDPNVCRVLARQAPAVGPVGLKEPRVIVGGTVLDVRTIEGHPLVSRLWSSTVQAWEAGRAISVHTGTPTGLQRPFDFLPDVPERVKPPSEPVFAGEN